MGGGVVKFTFSNFILMKNGVWNDESAKPVLISGSNTGQISIVDSGFTFKAEQNKAAVAISSSPIDLTDFSAIEFFYDKAGTNPFHLGIDKDGTNDDNFTVRGGESATGQNVWVRLDISNLIGQYYLKFHTTVYSTSHLIRAIELT